MALSERPRPFRDSSLFVLGLEGEESGAEYQYFSEVMTLSAVDRRRVRFVLLPTSAQRHDSDPRAVLERVTDFAAKNDLRDFDRVWLVLDVDSWGEKKLSEVAQEARTREFSLAVSNPCFEVWLLLHGELCDLQAIATAGERGRSALAKSLWRSNPASVSHRSVLRACASARELATAEGSGSRWPRCPGSDIHRLFEDLETRQAWRAEERVEA